MFRDGGGGGGRGLCLLGGGVYFCGLQVKERKHQHVKLTHFNKMFPTQRSGVMGAQVN